MRRAAVRGLFVFGLFVAGFSSKICSRRFCAVTHVARVPQTRRRPACARAKRVQKTPWQSSFQPRENTNLGDEHMTDETRCDIGAKVAERQAAEDALVQKRIEAAPTTPAPVWKPTGESGSRGTARTERVANVHTQVGTFKAEPVQAARRQCRGTARRAAFLCLGRRPSPTRRARVLALSTRSDPWGGADPAPPRRAHQEEGRGDARPPRGAAWMCLARPPRGAGRLSGSRAAACEARPATQLMCRGRGDTPGRGRRLCYASMMVRVQLVGQDASSAAFLVQVHASQPNAPESRVARKMRAASVLAASPRPGLARPQPRVRPQRPTQSCPSRTGRADARRRRGQQGPEAPIALLSFNAASRMSSCSRNQMSRPNRHRR